MASKIQQSSDLWDLEHYLAQRRKEIDRKYDSRSSRLTDVLGRLCTKIAFAKKICADCGREDEINSFFRSPSQRRSSLICILSAMACFRQPCRIP